ncbi:hypothetical protein [Papillibacter cinnamivorans]|uniref:Uncharacterized protein n=1 Tax=Papillibacter cinnamivorans DSM 12816 TaxID=1122930 RepID=A0A1W2BHD0_9FIRM|nr:hypothetical protein [Papillibacter cinnamivorans]SMC72353.1 hypothetical protein SAMN02745168_2201 [Papillibacter cinnamivorans DSM 12816]
MTRPHRIPVPLIALLILQYLHAITVLIVTFTIGLTGDATGVLFYIYCGLFVFVYIPNSIYAFLRARRGERSSVLLFWNMLIKLLFVPIYIGVFLLSILVGAAGPFALAFWAVFLIYDYMMLLTTSMYGLAGIRRARREGIITRKAAVVHSILHFFFCADVISSVLIYLKVKTAQFSRQASPDAAL